MSDREQRARGASLRLLQTAERELQRLLLDVHDGPVQQMYAALSQLELLRQALAPLVPDVGGAGGASASGDAAARALVHADHARRLLEEGLAEVRGLIGGLRPAEFAEQELRLLLEELVLHHETTTDTAVTLDVDDALPVVALPARIALYRVLQEALANAARHGGARQVVVRLTRAPRGGEWLRLRVQDDGRGFDPALRETEPAGDDQPHFGLVGMRTRVEMLGGDLGVHSVPGAGTTVVAEVPVA